MAEWGWSAQERLAWIEGCLELGVSSFDHADVYGDYAVESLFGEALALRVHERRARSDLTACSTTNFDLQALFFNRIQRLLSVTAEP